MKPYLFEYHQPEDHLFLTEYIYEIGTFHYNWHKDLEILVVLKGEVEVCAEERLYLLKEDDICGKPYENLIEQIKNPEYR